MCSHCGWDNPEEEEEEMEQVNDAARELAEQLVVKTLALESCECLPSIRQCIPFIQAAFDRVRAETKEEECNWWAGRVIWENKPEMRAHVEAIAAAIRASKGA